MKKIFTKKKIRILLVTILLLPVILLLLLHTSFFRSILKEHLQNLAMEQNIYVNAGSLEYNLLKPTFTLRDVTVSKSRTGENTPFFHAESITLEAPFSSLWNATPEVNLIDIRDPSVRIVIKTDGSSNIPTLNKNRDGNNNDDGKTGTEIKPIIHLLKVLNASFKYEDKSNGIAIDIPAANMLLNHIKASTHHLTLETTQKGTLTYNGRTLPIDWLSLKSESAMTQAEISSIVLKSGNSSFNLNGQLKDYLKTPVFEDFRLNGTLDLDELRTFLPSGTSLPNHRFHGNIKILSSLNGPVTAPRLKATIESSGAKDNFNNAIRLNGQLQLNEEGLTVPHFILDWVNNGRFDGKAMLYSAKKEKGKLSKKNNLEMDFDTLNIDALGKFFTVPALLKDSTASGKVKLNWHNFKLESLTGTAEIDIKSLAKASLKADSGLITLDLESLQLPELTAAGRFSWQKNRASPISGNFLIKTPVLQNTLPETAPDFLKRSLKLSGTVNGTFEKPVINASVLNAPFDTISFSGSLEAGTPFGVNAEVWYRDFPLHRLFEITGENPSIRVTGTSNVTLNLNEPAESLNLKATVNSAVISGRTSGAQTSNSVKLVNSGPIVLHYNPDGISIDQMVLKGDNLDLETKISGSLPFEPAVVDNIEGTGLNIIAKGDMKALGSLTGTGDSSGEMVLNAAITGTVSNPQYTGNVLLKNASFDSPDLPGTFEKANLDMTISADTLTVKTCDFTFMEIPFKLEKPSSVKWKNSGFTIDEFSFNGGDNRVSFIGTADSVTAANTTKSSLNLALKASGTIDMKLIDGLTDGIDIYGGNRFDISISGPPDEPRISGRIHIENGGIEMRDPDVFITQVNGTARLEGSRLVFEDIGGDLNSGKMTLSGELDLTETPKTTQTTSGQSKKKPSYPTFTVENARFNYPLGLETEMSGQLQLKPRTGGGFQLAGNVEVLRGLYRDIPASESEALLYLRPPGPDTSLLKEKSIMDDIHLDINMSTKTAVRVNQALSRSEVTAALTVTGTAAQPGLMGRVSVNRGGVLYFNNRTFEIEKGTVDFNNAHSIEPVLHLTAQTVVSGYEVTLQLDGTMEAMVPQLSSTPTLPNPDIISLLLTGQVKELIPDSKLALEERAMSVASYLASGIAEKNIKKFSGIDSIRLDTGQAEKDARVTFSQRLANQLELIFSQSLKDAQKQAFIVRFDPFRNVSMEAEKSMDNQYGLNFNHHFFFKLSRSDNTPINEENGLNRPDVPYKTGSRRTKSPFIGSLRFQNGKNKTGSDTNFNIPGVSMAQLRKRIKQKEGNRFNYFRFSRDLENLKKYLHRQGYLAAEIKPERRVTNNKAEILLNISPGPRIRIDYLGAPVPKRVKNDIRDILSRGRLSPPAAADALLRLRYHLYEKTLFSRPTSR